MNDPKHIIKLALDAIKTPGVSIEPMTQLQLGAEYGKLKGEFGSTIQVENGGYIVSEVFEPDYGWFYVFVNAGDELSMITIDSGFSVEELAAEIVAIKSNRPLLTAKQS